MYLLPIQAHEPPCIYGCTTILTWKEDGAYCYGSLKDHILSTPSMTACTNPAGGRRPPQHPGFSFLAMNDSGRFRMQGFEVSLRHCWVCRVLKFHRGLLVARFSDLRVCWCSYLFAFLFACPSVSPLAPRITSSEA